MQFGKKLFVMATAAIFIVACLIPFSFEPAMADDITWTEWSTDNDLPSTVGNYKLMTDVTITGGTWEVPAMVEETVDDTSVTRVLNLDLNGHVIKANTSEDCRFSVITVPNGATLNLYDSNPNMSNYFEYNSAGYYTLTNNTNGIRVNGGCITGGYTNVGSGADGGGVYVEGAFEMNGGTIIGNRAYKGGGVYVTDGNGFAGRFEMKGGSICGNLAVYGGGVGVSRFDAYYPSFIMSGGNISGNHATNDGGGVHVSGDQDAFKMQGTTISGNMANENGGGVYVEGGDFKIEGSTSVTGNYVNGEHSTTAISYVKGTSGSDNNVYLASGKEITVTGDLSGGANSIGVSAHEHNESYPFVVAANSGTLSADDIACFKSDSSDYIIDVDVNKKYAVLLGFYHIHLGTLLNNDAVESATATVDGTVVANAQTPNSTAIREDKDVTITFTINPWYALTGTLDRSLLDCSDTGGEDHWGNTIDEPDEDGTYSCTFRPVHEDVYIFVADNIFSLKESYEVEYKDATGALQSVTATTLTGNESSIGNEETPTWYVVPEGMTVSSRKLTLDENSTVNLILSDGAELIIGTEDNRVDSNCIFGNGATLNIYSQDSGTGKLDAYNEASGSSAVYVKNLTVNGGTLTVDASQRDAIWIDDGAFTMNGGNVFAKSAELSALKLYDGALLKMKGGSLTATSEAYNAIISEGSGSSGFAIEMTGGKLSAMSTNFGGIQSSISLDYTNADDSFFATSLGRPDLVIAEDKYFTDGENAYYGTLTSEQKTAAAGKTLRPANLVSLAAISNGTVTANKAAVAMNATGDDRTVTLTITPDSDYELDTLTVTKASGGTVEISGTGDTRTFTMPAENVNVTAIFAFVPIDPTGISLDKRELNVNTRSDSQTLTATIAPEGATGTLTWSSSNPGVATVTGSNDNTATVSFIGIGYANITVSIEGTTFTDVCTVTVSEYVCPHEIKTETAAKAATCTESGNIGYYQCNDCGKFFSDENCSQEIARNSWVIPALGHNYEPANYLSDDGQHWQVCTRQDCGATSEKEPHTFGDATYRWANDNSSCTASHTCTVCNKEVSETKTATSEITADATCTTGQIKTYTASFTKDGFTAQTKDIEANNKLGHDFTYTTSGAVITATCGREACEYHSTPLTLTLTAPANLYADGTAKAVTVAGLDALSAAIGDTVSGEITYVGRGETEYTLSTAAPTEVGAYTATFTLRGDYTVSLDYDIAQKPASSSSSSSHKADTESKPAETTSGADGSKTTTTTNTTTNADGSKTTTTTSTTTNADGSEAKATTQTTEKENADGTKTATTTVSEEVTEVAADGTKTMVESKLESAEKLDKDGNGTVEGTKTETKTDADGNVKETTVTEIKGTVETSEDGTKTTTIVNTAVTTDATTGEQTTVVTNETKVESPDGTTGTVVTDETGKTLLAEANVSQKAVETALKEDKPIPVPVTVNPAQAANAEKAAGVHVTLPTTDRVQVEIQVPKAGPGIIAMMRDLLNRMVPVKDCYEGSVIVPVTGSCELVIVDNTKSFADVADTMWYNEYVTFVTAREIFNGVNATNFAPNATMNRAMLAQVLYNFDGGVATGDGTTFGDVNANDWFNTAVGWAYENGIVNGFGKNFGALYSVSRQDMATILYRYAKALGYDVSASDDITKFADASSVSDYAVDAMKWAVGAGIIDGNGSKLDPTGSATRAQVAAIMTRFVRNMK